MGRRLRPSGGSKAGPARGGGGGGRVGGAEAKGVAKLSAEEFLSGDFMDGAGSDESEDEDSGADAAGDGDSDSEEGEEESDSEGDEEEGAEHERTLAALAEKDPEFFKYLKQNDAELLDFEAEESEGDGEEDGGEQAGAGGADDSGEEEEEDDDDDEEEDARRTASGAVATVAQVDGWFDAALSRGDVDAAKSIVRAFRAACYHGDDMDKRGEEALKVAITTSTVFTRVMTRSLTQMHSVFAKVFATGGQQGKKGKKGKGSASEGDAELPLEPERHSRWKKTVSPLAKSFISSAVHALEQMTDEAMLAFTLRALGRLAPLMRTNERLARKAMTQALSAWGRADGKHARHCAWELLHALALRMPKGYFPKVLKGMSSAYAAGAKAATPTDAERVAFQRECLVALCGEDLDAAYAQAFAGLRDSATQLRTALQGRQQADARLAQGWKTVATLELWAQAVCAYPDESELGQLAYPLCQILTGITKLQPSMQRWPLRLRVAATLAELEDATRSYIPLAAPLVEILTSARWRRPAKDDGGAGGQGGGILKAFEHQLLAPKSLCDSRSYQEEAVLRTLTLLSRHLAHWSYHIAFPELVLAPMAELRRFAKSCPVERFRRNATSLAAAVDESAAAVRARRGKASFAPKDTKQVEAFEEEGRQLAVAGGKKGKPSAVHAFYVQFKQAAEQRKAAATMEEVEVGGGSSRAERRAGMQAEGGAWGGGGVDSDDEEASEDEDMSDDGEDFEENEVLEFEGDDDAEVEEEAPRDSKKAKKAKRKVAAAAGVDVKGLVSSLREEESGDLLEDMDFDSMFDVAEEGGAAAKAGAAKTSKQKKAKREAAKGAAKDAGKRKKQRR